MSEIRILVTGANGQLGKSLKRTFERHGCENVVYTDVDTLDITDREAVKKFIDAQGFSHIVNCAAFTNVDKAETDSIEAAKLNTEAVGLLAEMAAKNGIKIIHISTDYVFAGDSGRTYNENDEPYPQTIYGRTKLEGEGILTAFCPNAIIIRTSWLYSEFGNNFVAKMLELAAEGGEIRVISDQIGTPTYAGDLAEVIYKIIRHDIWETGFYHFSNEGVASWYDFAMAIFRRSGHSDLKVTPIASKDFKSPAKRPLFSVLNKEKIKRCFDIKIPHWEVSLNKCLKNMKE